MGGRLRVLIVGGYGTFGGRIVQLLEDDPRIELVIAGRSRQRADAYVLGRGKVRAKLIAAVFDRDQKPERQLAELQSDVLVDASGPFQHYGEQRYRLVEACIKTRVAYLDLADGSEFVDGVATYDAAAREAGIFVLSGVSSFPVLTAAVVRQLSRDLKQVDGIIGGIAPSPYAGVGDNVVRAIASYAGQPIGLTKEGKPATGYPFTDHRRYTIAPPGKLPLRSTLFSLVDVPDLKALSRLWPEARAVWMGAGPVPEVLHRTLIALSWLVRWKLLSSLSSFAGLMAFATNRIRWGEHRGGMFVEVDGRNDSGTPVRRSWHLLAEGDDGPFIPSMAVQAVVLRILDGRAPESGARAAVSELELEDYEALFANRTIFCGTRSEDQEGTLYETLLGQSFGDLPPEIREMHRLPGTATGRAQVERGRNPLGRLAARLIGFPGASSDTPVSVRFDIDGRQETWTRTFGGRSFQSRQFARTGRSTHLLCEAFGPLVFAMALVVEGQKLRLVLRRWSAFGIPMPMWMAPRSNSFETVVEGKFCFHVEISHPLLGLIVRYRGWLAPEMPPLPPETESV